MNRSGGFQGSLLQQMARESSCWWTSSSTKSNNGEASSSSPLHHLMQISNSLSFNSLYESQELPQSWSQLLLGGLVGEEESYSIGTPRSCVTSSLSCSMLDFSNSKPDRRHLPIDHFSECNSIEAGATLKKARIHGTSSSQSTSFKVRKEKLGDRITVLHQLVSPFGKTDTASVLLEAIGYIRFLQSQIEALSSPYLTAVSVKKRHTDGYTKPKMDLRSRGLCLVPISCTLHVGNEDGVDY